MQRYKSFSYFCVKNYFNAWNNSIHSLYLPYDLIKIFIHIKTFIVYDYSIGIGVERAQVFKSTPELKSKIFDMLFRAAEISQLTPEEMETYKKSITEYADVQNAMLYASEKAMLQGIEKGRKEGNANV